MKFFFTLIFLSAFSATASAGRLTSWSYHCGSIKIWGVDTERKKIRCRVTEPLLTVSAEDRKSMTETGSKYSFESEGHGKNKRYFYQCKTSFAIATADAETAHSRTTITITARTLLPEWDTFNPTYRVPVHYSQSHRFYTNTIQRETLEWDSVESMCTKSAVYR